MNIVLTGGGTAGHVMANKVLIPFLQERNWEISYIGSYKGVEKQIVEDQGIAQYFGISTGKLRRYLAIENLIDGFRVLKGIGEAYRVLKTIAPEVVFSGGGFVSVPVVLAARLLNIPVVIRETDYTIGLANKICIPFAKSVLVTFPDTLAQVEGKSGNWLGMIIRPDLMDKQLFVRKEGAKTRLLIVGGSQGAEKINKVIYQNIDALTKYYDITHLCGRGKVKQQICSSDSYRQYEYVEDMGRLYGAADIVVTRCGSNAISEGISLGKRMICVPLGSHSRGEQMHNAKFAVSNGCAKIIEEDQLNVASLIQGIEELLTMPVPQKYVLSRSKLIQTCQAHVEVLEFYGKKSKDGGAKYKVSLGTQKS